MIANDKRIYTSRRERWKLSGAFAAILLLGSSSSYAEQEAWGEFLKDDVEVASVDYFSMSLEDLLNVKIATKTLALETSEAPAIVTVLHRHDLERMGYRHLGEALASIPGLFVINDLTTHNVGIRGIHGGDDSWSRTVKFMIDGFPAQYGPNSGALVGPELIPIAAIETIEVIRGPGSALYGANAFLGVVNVTTRSHAGEAQGVSGVAAASGVLVGDNPGVSGSAVATARVFEERPLEVLVSAGVERMDRAGLEVPHSSPAADAYAGQSTMRDVSLPVSVLGKANWDGRELGSLTLETFYQRLDADARFSTLSVLAPANHYSKSNLGIFGRYEKVLYERGASEDAAVPLASGLLDEQFFYHALRVNAWGGHVAGSTGDRELLDVGLENGLRRRDRETKSLYGGLDLSYALGKSSVLMGFDVLSLKDAGDTIYDVDRATGDATLREAGASLQYNNVAPYAQLIVYPWQWLGLTGGVRYDINSFWGSALSTRAAGVVEVVDGLHAKVLYGTSFQPPAPDQLESKVLAVDSGGNVKGNPDLESQRAETIEAQVNYEIDGLLEASLTGFRTVVHDRVEFVREGKLRVAYNITESTSWGAEMAASFRWRWLFASADVSFQTTRVEDPDVVTHVWRVAYNDDEEGGRLSPSFPQLMGHARAGVSFPEYHVEGVIIANLVGPRRTSSENAIANGGIYILDGYTTVDLNLRTLDLRLLGDTTTTFALRVTNLLGVRYAEAGYLGIDIPSLPRTFYLTLEQTF